MIGLVLQGEDLKKTAVRDVMDPPFPIVTPNTPIDQITELLRGHSPAVFVQLADRQFEIITKYDLIHSVTR